MSRTVIWLWVFALLALGCNRSSGQSGANRASPPGARRPVPPPRPGSARRPPQRRPPQRRSLVATPPRIRDLQLKGFAPSGYVAPTDGKPGPRPVLVLLHGSYDARTSGCRAWGRVGARHGWLLCPAGRRRPDEPESVDRWTWGKVAHLIREVRQGLDALEKLHPGRVDRSRLTLVGFSLGALLVHDVAYFSWGMYPRLIVVEGVARLRGKWARRLYARGVRRVAYVCGEKTSCPEQVPKRKQYLSRAGISVQTFVIPGVRHEYGSNFDPVAERILRWVLAERRASQYRVPRRRRRRR